MKLNDATIKVVAGVTIALIGWSASWVFSTAQEIVRIEAEIQRTRDRLQTVSQIAVDNSTALKGITTQVGDHNAKLLELIRNQDVRLEKIETILEHVVMTNPE